MLIIAFKFSSSFMQALDMSKMLKTISFRDLDLSQNTIKIITTEKNICP